MSKALWVGIDVSKHTFYAALAGEVAAPREWAALPAASFEHSRQGMERFVHWVDGLDGRGCRLVSRSPDSTHPPPDQ